MILLHMHKYVYAFVKERERKGRWLPEVKGLDSEQNEEMKSSKDFRNVRTIWQTRAHTHTQASFIAVGRFARARRESLGGELSEIGFKLGLQPMSE